MKSAAINNTQEENPVRGCAFITMDRYRWFW